MLLSSHVSQTVQQKGSDQLLFVRSWLQMLLSSQDMRGDVELLSMTAKEAARQVVPRAMFALFALCPHTICTVCVLRCVHTHFALFALCPHTFALLVSCPHASKKAQAALPVILCVHFCVKPHQVALEQGVCRMITFYPPAAPKTAKPSHHSKPVFLSVDLTATNELCASMLPNQKVPANSCCVSCVSSKRLIFMQNLLLCRVQVANHCAERARVLLKVGSGIPGCSVTDFNGFEMLREMRQCCSPAVSSLTAYALRVGWIFKAPAPSFFTIVFSGHCKRAPCKNTRILWIFVLPADMHAEILNIIVHFRSTCIPNVHT